MRKRQEKKERKKAEELEAFERAELIKEILQLRAEAREEKVGVAEILGETLNR